MAVDPRRQKQLFEQAVELPQEERAAFLDGACGGDPQLRARVEALLAALAAAADFLAEPAPAEPGGYEQPGAFIDRYKLMHRIGEGGFGEVWMAEQQEPVRRNIALKVIKLGMDSRQVVARFEVERQALALMDHPNIAKVLDGGVTPGGRPYFVMELIKGVPITEYCDEAQLDTPQRLELFQHVCHAVQHAHQKGVIHRDLKPTNILVTQHDGAPLPKVIDFGIAKATSAELTQRTLFTDFRQMVGTPEYMAPEQTELSGLNVDTRADVYSLGVVLYELLTGTRPFDARTLSEKGYLEMLRVIREDHPPKPSARTSALGAQLEAVARRRHATSASLSRMLHGDLDWIVMKALEKEPTRRYVTPTDFAADIGRHLVDEPVQACPPSAAYRLRKYVRRHRLAVHAGVAVSLALLAGLTAASRGWLAADEQRGRAQIAEAEAIIERNKARAEADRANAVIGLVETMLGSADLGNRGHDFTLRELLDDFDRGLGSRLAEQPAVEASLRTLMGQAYLSLGLHGKAAAHGEAALAQRRSVFGDRHPQTAAALSLTARALQGQGSLAEAEAKAREALAMDREVLGAEHPFVARHLCTVAHILQERGKLEEAEDLSREAVARNRRHLDAEDPQLANSLTLLSVILLRRSRLAEAEAEIREALELRARIGDESGRAEGLYHLGNVLMLQGRFSEAEQSFHDGLEQRRKTFGDGHPSVALGLDGLGQVLSRQGKHAEAEPILREALARSRASPIDQHAVVRALHNLAACLLDQGRVAEAETTLREALDACRAVAGDDHSVRAAVMGTLGHCLLEQKRMVEAEPMLREALDLNRGVFGNDHEDTATCLSYLGNCVMLQGRLAEAEPMLRETLDRIQERLGRDHWKYEASLGSLSQCLNGQGRFAEAEPLMRELLGLRRGRTGLEDEHIGAVNFLVHLLHAQGKQVEAELAFRESLAIARGQASADLALGNALTGLGHLLLRQGRHDEAEPLLREDLEARTKALPDSWMRYHAMSLLGRALLGQGRHDDAEPLLREGHDRMQPPPGRAGLKTQALESLVDLYEDWGKADEAAAWRAKLAAANAANR
jgi:tetratricopeptide (TPR) repeat protein